MLALRSPAPVRLVFDGQSHNLWPPPGLYDRHGPYPAHLMAGPLAGIAWANVAIGNTAWGTPTTPGTLAHTAPTRLHRHARNRPGCTDLLVMFGGSTDTFGGGGLTGAQVYARALDYAARARAAGFHHVIAVTIPVTGPEGGYGPGRPTAGEYAAQTEHNALMVAGAGTDWDAVVDLTRAPLLDPTDRTYWEADRVHLSGQGARIVAQLVHDQIAPLL